MGGLFKAVTSSKSEKLANRAMRKILEPFVVVAAAIYFALDAVFIAVVRPVIKPISRLRILRLIADWIRSLGPYQTLILFLIPLILLEPTKPLSAYLIATEHFHVGILVLICGEVLKIGTVERIFHIGRVKLMTIRWFAWSYDFIVGWLNWVRSLPPWQAVQRSFLAFKRWARALKLGVAK